MESSHTDDSDDDDDDYESNCSKSIDKGILQNTIIYYIAIAIPFRAQICIVYNLV